MNKVDKLIQIIHNIKEEGEGAIANVVGDGEKSLGYNIETGTPPVWKKEKKNYAKGGKGSRKWWLQYLRKSPKK
jgi:hypothetical protein